MLKHIILITGANRVGKTTFAEKLTKKVGGRVLSFAAPIHAVIQANPAALGGLTTLGKDEKGEYGISYRDACIALGEGMKKAVGSHVWADILVGLLDTVEGVAVVDDLRFCVELEAVGVWADAREIPYTVLALSRESAQAEPSDIPPDIRLILGSRGVSDPRYTAALSYVASLVK